MRRKPIIPMETKRSWMVGMVLLVFVFVAGTIGYHFTLKDTGWFQAFYDMMVIAGGVGFTDPVVMGVKARAVTIIIILMGMMVFAYFTATFASLIVYMVHENILERWLMDKKIKELRGHIIVCGYSKVSELLADQLRSEYKNGVVVVDNDPDRIAIATDEGLLSIEGDAKRKDVLLDAGIEYAKCLTVDVDGADNLFVVVLAKKLNKNIKIIVKLSDKESNEIRETFSDIGVDYVVDPYHAGATAIMDIIKANVV